MPLANYRHISRGIPQVTDPGPNPDPGPGADVPLQAVVYSNVGQINPYSVQYETPFIQSVAVPLAVNVPKGVYGVRIGSRQLAAQARTVKHRPNGNAKILRVEGVWPSDITTNQVISLTALPPDVTPEISVQLSSGNIQILRNGVVAHTLTPYAATNPLSGAKTLKGSNTSSSYIPKESFHEWHVPRTGSSTSVGAAFQDLLLEETTPLLRVYLARGAGTSNSLYEFQLRIVVYKYRPWIKWEYTTFKHFNVNLPSETATNPAISSERLTITPSSPFTGARMKSSSLSAITVEANPYGQVSGTFTGDLDDSELNAVRMAGSQPLSAMVCDFTGYGPCAIRATTASLILDFWSQHTTEVLDFRGTGKAGEVQADSSDYNASPRGTARTWEGFFAFEDNLPLVQKLARKDDLWFMTPDSMEASEAFGPLKASVGTTFAPWFKRVNAHARVGEGASIRHQHFGYAQRGLNPSVIPNSVNTSLDRYLAKEPMHSGRYGQSKDSYGTTGDIITPLLLSDRTRVLRALRSALLKADINGHHGMIFGTQYMGSNRDGVHRRYRDPWTGKANDDQYFYPEAHYTAYWVGGARRFIERATKLVDSLGSTGSSPYSMRIWGWAMRYQHTNDADDLTKLNAVRVADINSSNGSSDYGTPPSGLVGKPASMMWENFRYGHNTCPMVIELYEATGIQSYLDDLALAYRSLDFAPTGSGTWGRGMSSYGSHVTPYHALAYLRLRGYTQTQVSKNAMDSMQYWIGNNLAAGTFRNHNKSLPSGDPDNYSWADILTYLDAQTEEGPGFQKRFGPLIASWYAP